MDALRAVLQACYLKVERHFLLVRVGVNNIRLYRHSSFVFIFVSGLRHRPRCSFNTTRNWGRPTTYWSTPTSSTLPSKTRSTFFRAWWTVCTPSVSENFSVKMSGVKCLQQVSVRIRVCSLPVKDDKLVDGPLEKSHFHLYLEKHTIINGGHSDLVCPPFAFMY